MQQRFLDYRSSFDILFFSDFIFCFVDNIKIYINAEERWMCEIVWIFNDLTGTRDAFIIALRGHGDE